MSIKDGIYDASVLMQQVETEMLQNVAFNKQGNLIMNQPKAKPVTNKVFTELKVDDLKRAFDRIISQQFLQIKIERYERNFIWRRLLDELSKTSQIVEK